MKSSPVFSKVYESFQNKEKEVASGVPAAALDARRSWSNTLEILEENCSSLDSPTC